MDLKIAIYQMDIVWHEPDKNLEKIENALSKHQKEFDIFVLPEMFTSGFTKENYLFKDNIEKTLNHLKCWSKKFNALFMGSVICFENGFYFNRLYAVYPDGQIFYYDKRHLFTIAKEHDYYQPGENKTILEYKYWRILPLICFDLRFPVWSRNLLNFGNGYDISIYVANWPKTRIEHWNALLKARAIENQCYTIGVNRIGIDGYNIEYNGCSAIYDFEGKTMSFNEGTECIITTTLKKQSLDYYRNNFPAYQSADNFIIK